MMKMNFVAHYKHTSSRLKIIYIGTSNYGPMKKVKHNGTPPIIYSLILWSEYITILVAAETICCCPHFCQSSISRSTQGRFTILCETTFLCLILNNKQKKCIRLARKRTVGSVSKID